MHRRIVSLALFAAWVAAFGLQAASEENLQVEKAKPEEISQIRKAPENAGQGYLSSDGQTGYRLMPGVLDGLGGFSESNDYRISIGSGGQPSAIGIAAGVDYGVEAGFVHVSSVDHGDPNSDGITDLGDAIYLLNYLFRYGPDPCPAESGDNDCDGSVNLGDIIYLLNYLFRDGPAPTC